jgi:UDP-glucose 4-epimerase
MFGGAGSGMSCAVCNEPVRADQMEIDMDFSEQRLGDQPSLSSTLERLHARPEVVERYHLHARCFAAWEFERTKVEGTAL